MNGALVLPIGRFRAQKCLIEIDRKAIAHLNGAVAKIEVENVIVDGRGAGLTTLAVSDLGLSATDIALTMAGLWAIRTFRHLNAIYQAVDGRFSGLICLALTRERTVWTLA